MYINILVIYYRKYLFYLIKQIFITIIYYRKYLFYLIKQINNKRFYKLSIYE